MSTSLRLGIVGFGKIARDQHVPAIAATDDIELVATASRHGAHPDLPSYPTIEAMLEAEDDLDAVALCQPPQARFAAARTALLAGKHVFMEKPPGATISEVEALIDLARERQVGLFASWHSREAAAVAPAKAWLAARTIRSVSVTWLEDVRVWHPGQQWIWEPGGFGVFDPGINALSILTAIMPETVRVVSSRLAVPQNRAAPIAAELQMLSASGIPVNAVFDFRRSGDEFWDILVDTDDGEITLGHGGNSLRIGATEQSIAPEREYANLYERFVCVARTRDIDVDLAPLKLVADAFMCGQIERVEPFED